MIVALHVCHKDAAAAIRNLQWAFSLDAPTPHDCIITHEQGFNAMPVIEAARSYFRSVQTHAYPVLSKRALAWPAFQNWAWRQTALHIRRLPGLEPWLWWEQDAVALRAGWLDVLEKEYRAAGKLFMGASGATPTPAHPPHLNGVAIYPHDVAAHAPQAMFFGSVPFDVAGGWRVLEQARVSPLFQHVWSWEGNQSPNACTFTPDDLKRINPDAVFFHRCKDASLIEALRVARIPKKPSLLAGLRRRMRRRGEEPARRTLGVSANLTVVITNYQRPLSLWAAFESAVKAGAPHIVVTSSGTNEAVAEVHKRIRSWRPSTEIISESDDSGSNAAWIRGVEASPTEWVQMLHDDDMLLPEYKAVYPHLGKTDFICWDGTTHGDVLGQSVRTFPRFVTGVHAASDVLPDLYNRRLSPSPVAGVFRRKHLLDTFGCCTTWGREFYYHRQLLVGNDFLIWLKAAAELRNFRYITKPLISYGNHPGSATRMSVLARDERLATIYTRVKELHKSWQLKEQPV